MSTLTLSRFAQPVLPVTPLPLGPSLMLPSGQFEVFDNGHIFTWGHQWIVALGVSDKMFLVVRARAEKCIESRPYHELLGYLSACGVDLIPVDFRCPFVWRQGSTFESVRNLWVSQFFSEFDRITFRVPLPLSEKPSLTLHLADIAGDATIFWVQAGMIADAMFADTEDPDDPLRRRLARICSRWERHWNEALDQEAGIEDEWGWLPKCDAAWADLVRKHLMPHGYVMSAASLTRLL